MKINSSKWKERYKIRLFNAQLVYKRRWLLCGSTEYFINQCNMWNLFKNWKKVIQEKLKEKERVLREEIIIMKPAKKI